MGKRKKRIVKKNTKRSIKTNQKREIKRRKRRKKNRKDLQVRDCLPVQIKPSSPLHPQHLNSKSKSRNLKNQNCPNWSLKALEAQQVLPRLLSLRKRKKCPSNPIFLAIQFIWIDPNLQLPTLVIRAKRKLKSKKTN